MNRKTISLVIPCFNEAAALAPLETALVRQFAAMDGYDFEVVLVDDGSADTTLEQMDAWRERDRRVRVVALSRNFGKEAALTAGIDHASGDAVVPFDADLQDPPEVIAALASRWAEGAEVVLARRTDRQSDGLLKRASAAAFYALHRRLAQIEIPDNVGDFRLMDRVVVDALKQLPERQRFMKGLFAWVGFRTVIVDYVRAPRVAGSSKFSGWRLWNFALEGITSFSTLPLRVWTYVGGVGALLAAFYAVFIVARTLLHGIDVPGYASLLVVVLFLGSLQLLSIGLLGEYIGRIYVETKQRPPYLVRRRDRDG